MEKNIQWLLNAHPPHDEFCKDKATEIFNLKRKYIYCDNFTIIYIQNDDLR